MTSEEFHALVEQHTCKVGDDDENAPLTLAQLTQLERQKGVRFPAFYKEFLSMYGAGEFGSVDVLSPEPESGFPIWETTSRLENRECNFMGVVEIDSDYYGFLISMGSAQTTSGAPIMGWPTTSSLTGYPDFFDFLAKVGLGIWDESEAPPAGRRRRERRKS
jgi:SMI1-KNR4 cell-wall